MIQLFLVLILFKMKYLQRYEPCEDRYTQCKMWKMQNMCTMSGYREYMIRTCPEACNLCKEAHIFNQGTLKNDTQTIFHTDPPISVTLPLLDNKKNAFSLIKKPSENHSKEILSLGATPIPQAMRLIQSLSQMISQTSNKKNSNQNYDGRNKIRVVEKSKNRNTLQSYNNYDSYLLRKSKLDDKVTLSEFGTKESDENTLKMIIKNKKRSSVNFQNKKLKTLNKSLKHGKIGMKKRFKGLKSHKSLTQGVRTKSDIQSTYMSSTVPPTTSGTKIIHISSLISTQDVDTSTITSPPIHITEKTKENKITTTQFDETENQSTNSEMTSTPFLQTSSSVTEPEIEESGESLSMYSLIIKQRFNPNTEDKTSTEFSILKGNLVQDIGYTLGPDAVVGHVDFEGVKGKNQSDSLTKVYFSISGDISRIPDLISQINKGDVNGLRVQPYTFHSE